ncbi:TPA: hypothetical protein ACSTJX_005009, partial [Serratia fonticola]
LAGVAIELVVGLRNTLSFLFLLPTFRSCADQPSAPASALSLWECTDRGHGEQVFKDMVNTF